jgi:predicted amidohydrolase YtcJ
MESELEAVVRLLAAKRWPWRLHATYDESIGRALDVFERVNREIPLEGIHWLIDHAETITDRNIERIARLGGGVAVQHRMAYQGEYFVERYGAQAAERTPPVKRMLEMGVRLGVGTDATRVSSYNPWVALHWLISGQTVGGLSIYPRRNCVDRATALDLYTRANAWFSNEDGRKGQIQVSQLADFAVLSDDVMEIAEAHIPDIVSVLTAVGGKIVYGDDEFTSLDPGIPAPMPDWSPLYLRQLPRAGQASAHRIGAVPAACRVHGHHHALTFTPAADADGFWGAFGCSCWAF